MTERQDDRTLVPAMAANDQSPASLANNDYSSSDSYNSDALARELMMPTGEPAAAVIGACLLVGFVLFAGTFGHFAGGSHATRGAASERHALRSGGGTPPAPAAPAAG